MAKSIKGPMSAAIAARVVPPSGQIQPKCCGAVVDLSADYGADVLPPHVIQAVETSLDEGKTHYTSRPGVPALREAVAQKLAHEHGFTVDPATEVVISCGGREGMFVALQVLTQPDVEVLVPALRPAYIDEAIRLAGGTLVPVPLSPKEGFEIKASRIRQCLTAKSKVLVLFNPANPTGAAISTEELARIAALAQEHDLTIVSDASLDESRHTSIVSFPEAAERTVVIGSFSWFYNLASWQVGYFAGPKALVTSIRDLKQAMTICTSAMAQYAALEALTGPQHWLVERRGQQDKKRAFVLGALDKMGLPHSHPTLTPYIFVDVRGTGQSSEEMASWLLAEAGVALMPGNRFGPQGEGYVRLSLWPTFSQLEQALRQMRWALKQEVGGAV